MIMANVHAWMRTGWWNGLGMGMCLEWWRTDANRAVVFPRPWGGVRLGAANFCEYRQGSGCKRTCGMLLWDAWGINLGRCGVMYVKDNRSVLGAYQCGNSTFFVRGKAQD